MITAVNGSIIKIGGLAIDLSTATCHASGATTACASAFSSGQVASVFGAASPTLPATAFTASTALLRNQFVVQTAGATIELEGKVPAVTLSPAAFVIRGISVDASALTTGSLPAVGDVIRVLGTVASGGNSIAASSVKILQAARNATFGLGGDVASVTAGSAANTYVLALLGQSITVDATTRLADRSMHGGGAASSNPFNIATFPDLPRRERLPAPARARRRRREPQPERIGRDNRSGISRLRHQRHGGRQPCAVQRQRQHAERVLGSRAGGQCQRGEHRQAQARASERVGHGGGG